MSEEGAESDLAPPPGILATIAQAAGIEAAECLADAFGGRRVYLRSQTLAPLLGDGTARLVVQSVGAGLIEVPRWAARASAERRRAILAGLAAAEPVPDIARRLGITERAVRKIAKQHRDMQAPAPGAAPFSPRTDPMHATAETFETASQAEQQEAPPAAARRGPARTFKGPNHGRERGCIYEPHLDDYRELVAELNIVRGGEGLDAARADRIAEDWARMTDMDRRNAWMSARISLVDAQALRKAGHYRR